MSYIGRRARRSVIRRARRSNRNSSVTFGMVMWAVIIIVGIVALIGMI